MKLGKLYGIGIGSGDPEYLTFKAARILQSVDVIFTVISKNAQSSVSKAVVESVKPKGEICLQIFSMSKDSAVRQANVEANALEIMTALKAGKDCACATLGDATTYSTFGYVFKIIKKELPNVEIEIVPGITSFATLSSKAQQILVENQEQLHVVPCFKTDLAEQLVFPENSTTILLKTYKQREALFKRLEREENIEVIYGEHLGIEDEIILTDLEEIKKRPDTYLSLMMVKKKKKTV